ncbi:histidine kinase N-terminal 7TM domain-containing protein [Halobellus ruber]|uniref:histidine kinase n=1 Tax=Halobellus ruber TaxID=2761102 RepID=A0A7J9SJ10_9EURY|nr:histidine kinase N-terminal 7TM domain-containing protein [Halobellus ruber]MBB6644991.1 PAS domain S-box protein [Halobellus ruber]
MGPWQFSVFHIPILVGAVASTLLSIIAWRHREYRYARSLIVLLFGVTWWCLTYVVGLGTTVPVVKRLVYSLTYPAVGLVSIAWFVFAVQYTGRLRVPTGRELAALGVIPALTAVAGFTNQHHGLLWSSVDVVSRGQLAVIQTTPGVLFWAHTVQSYALVGLGTGFIGILALRSDRAYRSEAVVLAVAAAVPLGVNVLYLVGVTGTVDLTPAAFALSGTVLIAAAFRDQFLQTLPLAREIARDELIGRMTSPVIVVDKRARVVDINPAAESLADATTDVVGSRIETAFPDIAAAVDLRDGSTQRTEIRRTDRNGERHYEVETLPLDRGGGAIRGHLLRMHDVTKLKRNQRELVEERQFIDQALDALDDLFYVIDADGSLCRWNEQFARVTGYSEPELEGMDAVEVFPEEERERIADAIQATFEGEELPFKEDVLVADGDTVEADLLTADGERIPHEFTGARLEDEDGRLTGLVGIGRDISKRKERERRLRTFREAVEHAGRMIYWMDRDGTVEYVNPALEAQTKYDAADLVDEQTFPLASRAESEVSVDDIVNTLVRGETWRAEFTMCRNDGERRTVDQTLRPVYNDGRIERFVGVAGDITERKRQKQQLSVLQRIMRHDLRNNLNTILLSIQLARREGTNDAAGEQLDAAEEQLDAAEQTVNETLSLIQEVKQFKRTFEAGEVDEEVVDICEVVREQLEVLRAERTALEVSDDLPETARVVTNSLIERAVRNVLTNAVEHNDADTPEIRVALVRRQADDEVELRIEDNGPGIPEETIEVLSAERERQLDHLSGFGLWAVHWVLTVSGGRLGFAENEPRGTVAKLVLPAAQPADQPHTNN